MNKTFLKVLGISLAVVFAVFMAACPEEQDNNNNGKNFEIAGTYNFTYTNVVHTWVFNADKTFKISWVRQSERNYTGTWSVSGNEITLQLDTVMGVSLPSEKFTASRSGKEVTLTLKGNAATSTTFAIFSMAATSLTLTEAEGSSGGGGTWTPDGYSPIQLTENQWANGNITTSDGQQWFTFTCTQSGNNYIHVSFGTLTDLYVQVYDSYGDVADNKNESNISSTSSYHYTSRNLSSGKKYYIKVWPSGSGSGTYRIAFNRMWFSADYDSVNGFIFEKNTSTITIAGYTGPMNGAVNIPSTIDGKTVVSIGNGVFDGIGLTSVTIPNGVITIGDWAFGWNHLTSVTIPDSVTTIGDWAFIGDNISPGGQMTSVIIPNSVTSIGGGAFWNQLLASVTIGANVELKTYFSGNDGGGNNRDGHYDPFPNNFSSVYNPNKQAGTYIFTGTIEGPSYYTGSWSKQN